jgi:hypothetical protein
MGIQVYFGLLSTEMPDRSIMRIVIIRKLAILHASDISSHAAPN